MIIGVLKLTDTLKATLDDQGRWLSSSPDLQQLLTDDYGQYRVPALSGGVWSTLPYQVVRLADAALSLGGTYELARKLPDELPPRGSE